MLKSIIIYRHAFLAGIMSWLALFLCQRLAVWWIFIAINVLWLAGLIWFFHFSNNHAPNYRQFYPLLVATAIAFSALMTLSENAYFLFDLQLLAAAAVGVIFFIPRHQVKAIHHEQKSWRRILMMLWVFDAYAIVSTLFALAVFFTNLPFVMFAVFGAMVYGYAALAIWQMYFKESWARFLLWAMVLALIMLQLIWVVYFWPLGPSALGLVVTWIWYLLQLFIRFHLTAHGVEWDKQWRFLVLNIIMMIGFLVWVVRWI